MSELGNYRILENVAIGPDLQESWQATLDVMAEVLDVPSVAIMRLRRRELEVFVTSHSPGNMYTTGHRASLGTGQYCESVMSTETSLHVPDATKDPNWHASPGLELGAVSYCGFALRWPEGEIFGTLCAMDSRPHALSERENTLLERFRDGIESGLRAAYLQKQLQVASDSRFDNLAALVSEDAFMYRKGADGQVESVSNSVEAMLGLTPADFIRDYGSKMAAAADAQLLPSAEPAGPSRCEAFELECHDADGTVRWIQCFEAPIRSDRGHTSHIEGLGREVTSQKLAEQAMRSAKKMDAIGQLTGGIAHDFNNILGVIAVNLDLLEWQVPSDTRLRERVEACNRAVERASDLTGKLLAFARRQGRAMTATDINEVIQGLYTVISRSVTQDVSVAMLLTPDVWSTEIDPDEFEDALINLSINARDAMASGGKLIIETANVTREPPLSERPARRGPHQFVLVRITDTGSGIAREHLDRIFEPFFTTKSESSGTGLGLSMVYGFIKRSGGFIDVKSEIGTGTTMELFLPRCESVVAANEESDASDSPGSTGNESILIVDDNAELLELTRQTLARYGYRVSVAANGPEALEVLDRDLDFDLLLSDIVMPRGMDGFELSRQARGRKPGLKVLLTTGYTQRLSDAERDADYSDVAFIAKPFRRVELAERVREVLDNAPPTGRLEAC